MDNTWIRGKFPKLFYGLIIICAICLVQCSHIDKSQHLDNNVGNKNISKDTNDVIDVSRSIKKYDQTLSVDNVYVSNYLVRKSRSDLNNSNTSYVKHLFEKFGNSDNSLDMVGFEKMLDHLGLSTLFNNTFKANVTQTEENVFDKCLLPARYALDNSKPDKIINRNNVSFDNDLQKEKKNLNLNESEFKEICPVLLYHLLKPEVCRSENEDHHSHHNHHYHESSENSSKVVKWLYACLSVLLISLCGLLGVFIIPFMEKPFYAQLLQFLVALAIGTLCGDALLHLLPHAIMPHSGEHDHDHAEISHSDIMWKGFAAAGGIICFYFLERILVMCGEYRKMKQREILQKKPQSVEILKGNGEPNSTIGDKLCKHTYSSYPYCYDDIKKNEENREPRVAYTTKSSKIEENCEDHVDHTTQPAELNHSHILRKYREDTLDVEEIRTLTSEVEIKKDEALIVNDDKKENHKHGEVKVILREHGSDHRGHSHIHGHIHSPPETMSSVAWMVILGDGLHNFTDGMAIGAAFAGSVAGGCSTAIAVTCHELPHELGDFAVLLKAGMNSKEAIFYNVLTSGLSLLGMVLGLLLGDVPHLSSWVFAVAAGVFLYIGLVDMFQELSSHHSGAKLVFNLTFLQGAGLSLGFLIMLLISYYEDSLKSLF